MDTFFIETYGCQMNIAESTSLSEIMKSNGFKIATSSLKADIIILNTCSVRKTAENRIWGRIGYYKGLKAKKDIILLVMGCMAERVGEEFLKKTPTIDIVIGTFHKYKIPSILKSYTKGEKILFIGKNHVVFNNSFPDEKNRKKAYVNISHGCNNFCNYCIVPYLRGSEISRDSNEIISDINNLVNNGVLSVTLLGQNVNSYGNDTKDINFVELLKKIENETDIKWIKYLSSHPKDFNDDLIEYISNSKKVSTWLHLALQSGSNKILSRMNRKYTREEYLSKINKFKSCLHIYNITTDIMVGFCGESDEDFSDTLDLVKEIRFNDAYMYKYNERENTFATNNLVDDVDEEIKLSRLSTLIDIQRKISCEKKRELIGKKLEILPERDNKKGKGEILGVSKEDFIVVYNNDVLDNNILDKSIFDNNIINVKIKDINGNTLIGEKIL